MSKENYHECCNRDIEPCVKDIVENRVGTRCQITDVPKVHNLARLTSKRIYLSDLRDMVCQSHCSFLQYMCNFHAKFDCLTQR